MTNCQEKRRDMVLYEEVGSSGKVRMVQICVKFFADMNKTYEKLSREKKKYGTV